MQSIQLVDDIKRKCRMKSISKFGLFTLFLLQAVLVDSSSASPEDGTGGSGYIEYFDSSSADFELNSESSWGEESNLVSALNTLPTGGEKKFYSRVLTFTCPKRPGKLNPKSPHGVEIYLHRPNDVREPVIYESKERFWRPNDVDWLVRNGFDTGKPTMVYLGGWQMHNKAKYLKSARRSLDRLAAAKGGDGPFNMIIFDWIHYGYANYGKSVSMVPHLGQVLGNFFQQLIDRHSYKANQLHIVAYSLSTHIAGLAARHLQESGRGLVNQITAIDPTGVCFHRKSDQVFDKQYSLRATDAKLVVARHYNMKQLGAGRLIGGVDIVLNGGETQPRMSTDRKKLKDLVGALLMSPRNHHRAIFHEAHMFEGADGCQEIAYECPSLKLFNQGQCADCGQHNKSCMLINTLGNVELNLRPADVDYKLGTLMQATTGRSQFCTHNYQILMELKPGSSQKILALFEQAKVKFKLDQVEVRPEFRVESETGVIKYTQLLKFNERIAKFPKRLRVELPSLFKSIQSISINYLSNISPQKRAENSIHYHPDYESNRNELVASPASSEQDHLRLLRLKTFS